MRQPVRAHSGHRAPQPAAACNQGLPAGCTIFAPQGVQADAKTPTVQQWSFGGNNSSDRATALRVTYIGSFAARILSIDPNSVPAQICSSATCATAAPALREVS